MNMKATALLPPEGRPPPCRPPTAVSGAEAAMIKNIRSGTPRARRCSLELSVVPGRGAMLGSALDISSSPSGPGRARPNPSPRARAPARTRRRSAARRARRCPVSSSHATVEDLERLQVRIEVQGVVSALASYAGDTHAPEGRRQVADEERVDPDHAGAYAAPDAVGAAHRARVHDAGEAVRRGVGEGDRIFLVGEGLESQNGAEDLVLHDLGVVGGRLYEGWLVEQRPGIRAASAAHYLLSALAGPIDEALHTSEVVGVDQGRDRRLVLAGISEYVPVDRVMETLQERLAH